MVISMGALGPWLRGPREPVNFWLMMPYSAGW